MPFDSLGRTAVCLCSGRAVALDEPTNRYMLLTGPTEVLVKQALAFPPLGQGQLEFPLDVELTGKLSDRRLIACSVAVPTTSLMETGTMLSLSYMDIPSVGLSLTRAVASQRVSTFAGLMGALRRRRALRPPDADMAENSHEILRQAAKFNAARALFPFKPICMRDSLALLDFLWHRGLCPYLVIGVRLNPFSAHCWVQTRDVLLNETADNAAAFQPIQII